MSDKKFKDTLLLITYGIILFVLLMNYKWILNLFSLISKVMIPFAIGFIIALILNVLVNTLENKLLFKVKKYKRSLSIVLSLVIIFGFIAFLMFILIPQIKNAGTIFAQNIPKYQQNINELGKKVGLTHAELEVIDLENNKIKKEITSLLAKNKDQIINISMGLASSFISVICNFFIGLVFALYILLEKENLIRQIKKLLKCLVNEKIYTKICDVAQLSNITFSNFIKVQVLEAIILGTLCFLGMLLLRLPYSATISVLVGVTALIPIFGAFIGCIVGAFLIFMISPIKALTFIIFFLVLQQLEGNFIYPKVVGGKIGLPSIWVLVAVTIGGSIGGVLGMLLGVPIVSVMYSLIKIFVNKRATKET